MLLFTQRLFYSGIACGVVIILTSIITCVILTCLIWRGTRHKSHTLRQDVEPTYEYVKDVLPVTSDWEVKVESNVCYATGITQEPNICYVTGLGETKESEYAEIQSGATVITTRLNEAYGRANQVARQVTTNATTCTSGQDEGEKELPQSSPDSVRAHQQDSQRNSTIDEWHFIQHLINMQIILHNNSWSHMRFYTKILAEIWLHSWS